MVKKRYKFNLHTRTFEIIAIPFRIKFYRFLRQLLIAFILASIVNLLFSFIFYTPKMYRIQRDNQQLLLEYDILNNKIRAGEARLREIHHRDNSVYRSLFGVDSLDIPAVYMPYADAKYAAWQADRYAPLMTRAWEGMDAFARRLYLASVSLDELEVLAQDKEKMAEAIPAIWPLDKRRLRGHIGAFGGRINPVLGIAMRHTGIDLGGEIGLPIYATGDAQVVIDANAGGGYGKQILLDHGFGYKTRYAHLSKIDVVAGQRVRRGEKIGELGNTGRSTGPHLHYEVIYRGIPVDPLNYFSRDMSEEEFERIIELARATTYESNSTIENE